eukprot:12354399-Ditylum_brightwellii.AAC.1
MTARSHDSKSFRRSLMRAESVCSSPWPGDCFSRTAKIDVPTHPCAITLTLVSRCLLGASGTDDF